MQHLEALGWRVVGVAPVGSHARHVFEEYGYPVAVVPLTRSGANPAVEAGAIWSVRRCLRDLAPVALINATVKPVLYGTLAASWLRIPVLNLITGLGFAYTSTTRRARITRPMLSGMYRAVFAYPRQRVVLQNEDDLSELVTRSGLRQQQALVVPGSGVDVAHFSPPANRGTQGSVSPLVVLPGRMLYDKGVLDFVEAARVVRRGLPSVRFALVGPTDDENPSAIPRALLDGWRREGLVEWWGAIPDIREAYHEAAVVVLPSRREGMPKVVLEAAACGIPVVTTDVPGCRESVIEGLTGFIVPFGDSTALADRICRLLGNRELRLQFGRCARTLAEDRFAAAKVVRRISEALSEVL